ncbi:MAG: hypothetical protein PF961_23590 [Planctomycetota bacterium]|nr:hypothetical protein [Planctomycetota bacterium]
MGVDVRTAAFGALGGGAIAVITGLAQLRLLGAGLQVVFAAQLAALLMRLVCAVAAVMVARNAGMDAHVVATCMGLTLGVAIIADAAVLARASDRRTSAVEDLVRA